MAFLLHVSVRARRRVVHHQLAAGIDPGSDLALGMRAAQLCRKGPRSPQCRRRLRHTIAAAQTAPSDRLGFAPLARSEILAEADALMDLVDRLEAAAPVEAMGVALARQLVSDTNGPLAVGADPGTLHMVVRLATMALDISPGHGARGEGEA